MVLLRILAFVLTVTLCSGCGYVHLGRLPATGAPRGEFGGADASADLRLEHKLLQQELALVRRESDGLRAALERARAGRLGVEPVRRPAETAPEPIRLLAAAAPNEVIASRIRRPADLDPRFVATLQEQARLQGENARLHRELERARAENAALGAKLKIANEAGQHAQAGVAQLGSSLRVHQVARAEAEQKVAATQIPSTAVLASGASGSPPPGTAMRALRLAKAPPADAIATVELGSNPGRWREAVATGMAPRVHVIQAGETWVQLAERYFGGSEHARRLQEANPQLASDRPLPVGVEVIVPIPK